MSESKSSSRLAAAATLALVLVPAAWLWLGHRPDDTAAPRPVVTSNLQPGGQPATPPGNAAPSPLTAAASQQEQAGLELHVVARGQPVPAAAVKVYLRLGFQPWYRLPSHPEQWQRVIAKLDWTAPLTPVVAESFAQQAQQAQGRSA